MTKPFCLLAIFLLLAAFSLSAQDFGFGFGDEDDSAFAAGLGAGSSFIPAVTIGGEVKAEFLGYVKGFPDGKYFPNGADQISFGDVFSGKLNFSAGNSYADAVINLKLAPTESPVSFDEAYVRAFFGGLEVEGGLRKLSWGKADSLGPLDVVNPLDYSELTDLSNIMNLKIAQPMLHLSYRVGSFSKIEGVFVPSFQPMKFADSGRWEPAMMRNLYSMMDPYLSYLPEDFSITLNEPTTSTLNYAQGGVRFTTTIGPADIGVQYYYGRMTRPAYGNIVLGYDDPMSPIPSSVDVDFIYNPYHQIGFDWAQVLFGFNIRAEFAANITEDWIGDDPTVYNPNLVWSFGFDRDLIWGINLNIQCNETIRLMHNGTSVGISLADGLFTMPGVEADTKVTSTQIIAALSKSFLRDELAARVAVFWSIETKDFLIIPSLVWTKDAVAVELSGGIFGGNEDGDFGQYKDNSFVKMSLTYSF